MPSFLEIAKSMLLNKGMESDGADLVISGDGGDNNVGLGDGLQGAGVKRLPGG